MAEVYPAGRYCRAFKCERPLPSLAHEFCDEHAGMEPKTEFTASELWGLVLRVQKYHTSPTLTPDTGRSIARDVLPALRYAINLQALVRQYRVEEDADAAVSLNPIGKDGNDG